MLRCILPDWAVQCYATLVYVILRYAMLCHLLICVVGSRQKAARKQPESSQKAARKQPESSQKAGQKVFAFAFGRGRVCRQVLAQRNFQLEGVGGRAKLFLIWIWELRSCHSRVVLCSRCTYWFGELVFSNLSRLWAWECQLFSNVSG